MDSKQLKNVVEAALLAAGDPLTVDQLRNLFGEEGAPEKKEIRQVIKDLQAEYGERGIEVREVASGFRIQVRENMGQWLEKLFAERPPRYTRALMETLAIIAYRQPVTRGDIEEIRGVTVSPNIIRTLLERDWIKVVGHRDVPGKPAMFGTTRFFLDYFGLKKLDELPPLAELASLEPVGVQLELGTDEQPSEAPVQEAEAPIPEAVVREAEENQNAPDVDLNEATARAAPAESAADERIDQPVESESADEVSEELLDENPNIALLDDARVAASRESDTDFNAERAEVVPIKQS